MVSSGMNDSRRSLVSDARAESGKDNCMDLTEGVTVFQRNETVIVDVMAVEEGRVVMESTREPLLPKDSRRNGAEPEERLASLDVFRGLTIGGMIVVDYFGGIWSQLNHSPWNGVYFADFVMPGFLFIVGVSLALTFKKTSGRRSASLKLCARVLKLFALGLILQGGYFHGMKNLGYGVDIRYMRIMGILQRIALAYLVVAVCEICTKRALISDQIENVTGLLRTYYWHWIISFVLLALYLGTLYGLYVPDWQIEVPAHSDGNNSSTVEISLLSVKCNVRGDLGPACNAAGYVDRTFLGINHMYGNPSYMRTKDCSISSPYSGPLPDGAPAWCHAPFDPEGLLSSFMAIITCFIGAHYGHSLIHFKGHRRRLYYWLMLALLLSLLGILLNISGLPFNKSLYTLSYTCMTAGVVALLFSLSYILVDVYGWKRSTFVFKWMGMHSLAIYALAACAVFPAALKGFYWKTSDTNLVSLILKRLGF